MNVIRNQTFDAERALYASKGVYIKDCRFTGPADGESAFKESSDITAECCYFDLRYPFWHDCTVKLTSCELTKSCRAALWYSKNIELTGTKLHGVKALRECADIVMSDCDIISPEFGWSLRNVTARDCTAEGEYFMLRSEGLHFENVRLNGKYSFQYIQNSVFKNCIFNTKDAFWHAKDVTVKNSIINGEYLGWYSERLTLENCEITGTQPLCYCSELHLIDCKLHNADLSFEKSDVIAEITAPMLSIKNPRSGRITLPSVGEIIRDDPDSHAEIIIAG